MEYRRLGRSGLEVSAVGLGGNTFGRACDRATTARILDAALDLGIQTVDTADIYNNGASEEFVGAAIRARRRQWVVMTKFAMPLPGEGPNRRGASRRYIRDAVVASLRRLGTDYIDVYQVHQPDRATPVEETMSTLHDLVREGLVRYIGCSNYPGWMVAQANEVAARHGWTPLVSSQPRYNLLDRAVEAEHLPACEAYGVGLIPWGPLAGGFLTGKYRRDQPFPEGSRLAVSEWSRSVLSDRNWAVVERLRTFAAERGIAMPHLAVGWLLSRPAVATVIVGATAVEQLADHVAGADLRLSTEDLRALEEMTGV